MHPCPGTGNTDSHASANTSSTNVRSTVLSVAGRAGCKAWYTGTAATSSSGGYQPGLERISSSLIRMEPDLEACERGDFAKLNDRRPGAPAEH